MTTYDLLSKKLKNAPQSVLEKVNDYIDSILKNTKDFPYKLTSEQQKILDNQVNLDSKESIEAGKLLKDLKSKYAL